MENQEKETLVCVSVCVCALSFLIHLFYRVCVCVYHLKRSPSFAANETKHRFQLSQMRFSSHKGSRFEYHQTQYWLYWHSHTYTTGWYILLGVKLHFHFPTLNCWFLCVFFFSLDEICFFYIIFWSWGCEPKRCFPKMHKSNGMKRNGDERWGKTTKYGQHWLTFSLSKK